jgi:DNA mismatch repair protein MutS
VLRRAVTRVVTPGTLVEERFLDPRAHQFLVAVAPDAHGHVGVAWLDISTGLLRLAPSTTAAVAADVARIQAKEVVVDRAQAATAAAPVVAALRASKQLLVSLLDRTPPAAADHTVRA